MIIDNYYNYEILHLDKKKKREREREKVLCYTFQCIVGTD